MLLKGELKTNLLRNNQVNRAGIREGFDLNWLALRQAWIS